MTQRGRLLGSLTPAWRRPAALLVLTAALALSGCGTAPRAAGPALDENDIHDLATLLQLEDRRTYDAATFERLADAARVEVRGRVAIAAGRIGDVAATPLLLRLLASDPSPAVRADAAFALGLLGDDSPAVLDGLEAAVPGSWVPATMDEVPVVAEVIGALGRLGGERSQALIHSALAAARTAASDRHRRVAADALLTVWKLDDGPANVRAALPYLEASDPELRWRAAYALMRGADPSALRPLLDHQDEDHRVRAYTARALTARAADSAGVSTAALTRLAALLDDPHPHVRINAVRALAGYGDRAPAAAMAPLLHDADPAVGVAAAGSLGLLGPRARDPLLRTLDDPSLPLPLRGAVLEAVAPLAADIAAQTAHAWARLDPQHRYFAARALAGVPEGAAPALDRRLAEDPDRRVALAALTAIAGRGGSPADSARLVAAARRFGVTETAAAVDRSHEFYEEIVRRYIVAPLSGAPRPRVRIETLHGPIVLELLAEDAPLTVHNFVTLTERGFFDDGVWHRVIPNFVLQDGAPGGYADGGPGWTIRDEINRHRYGRGTLGMALSGPDTGGSQWFIAHSPQPHLDGGYTVFGRVVDGMAAADAVLQGELIPAIRSVR